MEETKLSNSIIFLPTKITATKTEIFFNILGFRQTRIKRKRKQQQQYKPFRATHVAADY